MKRLPSSCHCPDPSCTATEETEMEYARQTLRLVEERDEAREVAMAVLACPMDDLNAWALCREKARRALERKP